MEYCDGGELLDRIAQKKFFREKEAAFIKKVFKEWQEIKSDLKGIVASLKSGLNQKTEMKEKRYMGQRKKPTVSYASTSLS